uniref:NADH dehydrogenase [ubiquinone] 1 beta subcomplex subunit 10 n=1 Tax=Timema tahoe TaxID=61484 RepID=A0A7R9FNX3_9NEOP|nr:unnamed protein product [Timema tahoe]
MHSCFTRKDQASYEVEVWTPESVACSSPEEAIPAMHIPSVPLKVNCGDWVAVMYNSDWSVDSEILSILRQRFEDCVLYEAPDEKVKCKHLFDQYNDATESWFTKYGDLGAYTNVKSAFMKQKHRMIWERRHGPVGSGMKEPL